MPGYLFAGVDARARRRPVSRLRVVLPAEAGVCAVRHHICRRDRAVSGVRCGHFHSHDDTCHAVRAGDLRVLVSNPLAIALAVLFLPAPRRRSRSSRAKARSRPRRAAPAKRRAGSTADPSSNASWRRAAAHAARHPRRRRQGADRQVQRLPVPGLRAVVSTRTSRSSRSTQANPGRGQGRHEGLPAQLRRATPT